MEKWDEQRWRRELRALANELSTWSDETSPRLGRDHASRPGSSPDLGRFGGQDVPSATPAEPVHTAVSDVPTADIRLRVPLLAKLGFTASPGEGTWQLNRLPGLQPTKNARRVFWSLAIGALAAGLLVWVGVPFWNAGSRDLGSAKPSSSPVAQPVLQMFLCELDQQGQVVNRKLLEDSPSLRSGQAFQLSVAHQKLEEFSILHIAPGGNVGYLYESKSATRPNGHLILPSPQDTYVLDDTSGWETILLIPSEDVSRVTARISHMASRLMAAAVLRGVEAKLSQDQALQIAEDVRRFAGASSLTMEHLPE